MNWRVWCITANQQLSLLALMTSVTIGLIGTVEAAHAAVSAGRWRDVSSEIMGDRTTWIWESGGHPMADGHHRSLSAPNAGMLESATPSAEPEPYARLAAGLRAPVIAKDGDRQERPGYLRRARLFMAAGDYRRALDACLFHLWEQPSVESYVYLTYVYHAIDGYMEHLASKDRWVAVEHLFLNLAARGAIDIVEPPDVLARMAKEVMHNALQKQSDVASAMAARLDREAVSRMWSQQSAWRAAHPDDWWAGAPDEWGW